MSDKSININHPSTTSELLQSKYCGRVVSSKSNYDHDVWYLDEYYPEKLGITKLRLSIDFTYYNRHPKIKSCLKDFAFTRMFEPPASYHAVTVVVACDDINLRLKKLYNFLIELGIWSFDQVDHLMVEKYKKHLYLLYKDVSKDELCIKQQVRSHLASIGILYGFRRKIGYGLAYDPFDGKNLNDIVRVPSLEENRTQPIPECIYLPLLYNAIYVLENYAHPILLALKLIRDVNLNRLTVKPQYKAANKLAADAARSIYSVEKFIGFNGKEIIASTEMKNVAKMLEKKWTSQSRFIQDLTLLRNANFLIIASLTAMRTTELLLLKKGCCTLNTVEDDSPIYKIYGTLKKKQGTNGKGETWGTVKEVDFAIQCLENINHLVYENKLSDYLFVDGIKYATGGWQFGLKNIDGHLVSYSLVLGMNSFRDIINDRVKKGEMEIPIPISDDSELEQKPFNLTPRKFRRTLARYIAREPFGMVGGMLHFKHVGIAIFEGYAGTDNEWLEDCEEEESIASIDLLEEMAHDLVAGELAGGLGQDLTNRFKNVFNGIVGDIPASSVKKWLQSEIDTIYPAKFNLCIFDPKKAMCLMSAHQTKPITNMCDPKVCGNSCVGKKHKPVWNDRLLEVKELLKTKGMNQYQIEALKNERSEILSAIKLADNEG